MARVSYVEDAGAPSETQALFDSGRRIVGRISNYHRIMAHAPWFYRWYLPMLGSFRHFGTLDERTIALAHIRTSIVNACAYCTSHNVHSGRERAGLTEGELAGLEADDPTASGQFGEREAAILKWIDGVALNTARRDTRSFEALRAHLSETEIVELTLIISLRTMANRIQEALWTDIEDPASPDSTKKPEAFDRALVAHCELLLDQVRHEFQPTDAQTPSG